ncbi:MAG TPA: cytochrome c-type biogenesis protein [Steroidobacteraceae bacterium]|jgi:cytochrome c-type biogenesis protein CcmH|nr:cytochrome c-type biogenesis protein [Steroidobacteraceae bacterium]
MRYRSVILVLCTLLALTVVRAALAVDPTQMPTPALQARYLALTHELRCMQCQNETLADSPVSLAADLRAEVRDMLLAGKSDDDVRAFMVARYGDFILFRPRFTARTAWLWLAPGILLAIGAAALLRVLRQRKALLAADTEPVDEDGRA